MFIRILIFCTLLFPLNILSAQSNCLFKNPLCFYNSDVLSYLQVLHKHQQYEKMTPFFYGPLPQKIGQKTLIIKLAEQDFGYSLRRVGIKEESEKHWSLTYQRTILGTQENFKIQCTLINDSCRIFLDESLWKILFR